MDSAEAKQLIAWSLNEKKLAGLLKKTETVERLIHLIGLSEKPEGDRTMGVLLEYIGTKAPSNLRPAEGYLMKKVAAGDLLNKKQADAAFAFLKELDSFDSIDDAAFNEACGVGAVVTDEEIQTLVASLFEAQAANIEADKWNFNFGGFIHRVSDELKWADGGKITTAINGRKDEILGPMPKDWKKNNKKKAPKKEKKGAQKKEEKKEEVKDSEYKNELFETKDKLSTLIPRDIDTAHNTKELKEAHLKATGGKIMTRFPPEPNGFLHIGHAKAMRFSFETARDYEGHCYLRFDDTNPEKESQEYIDSIISNVEWLGYSPY